MRTTPERQRRAFYRDHESGQWSMTELCQRFQISRPTGYKWIERIREEGLEAVEDRSRAPDRHPNQTPGKLEREILALREKYGWGAKKLLHILKRRHPHEDLPARSTVNAILDRHGKLRKSRRRRKWAHPGAARLRTDAPNQVWPADFKGQFKTKDSIYCYPLTVTDHYSRKLLLCKGLPSVKTEGAKPAFARLFQEFGLPDAIRTDNGVPFASQGIYGLCELNVWWMRLGIVHQRITPRSPQENGQHERMHKDLKREATRPPAANLRQQQKLLDAFQDRYNAERPHEAIGGAFPDELYKPSKKKYSGRLRRPEYPGHFEIRKISTFGAFRFHSKQIFLSNALVHDYIGLEEIDEGIWNIVYYNTVLGRLNRKTGKITGHDKV